MKVHMWAVFADKVKDPNGARMISNHGATIDPQALYAALHDHYTNSQVAVLRANELRTEPVSSTIPTTRAHTLMHYILIFFAKVHEYNKMVKVHNLMDPTQQLTHFTRITSAVSPSLIKPPLPSTPFQQIRQLIPLLKYRCTSAMHNVSTMPQHETRPVVIDFNIEVNQAHSSTYNFGDELFEGLTNDDPRASYEAYATFYGMYMNHKTWDSLSQSDKESWDKISQAGKNTILCSRPLSRGIHNTNPWTPHDTPGTDSCRQLTTPALPSAVRSREAHVSEQPPRVPYGTDHYPSAIRQTPTHYQVNCADAILRASGATVPTDGSCIFRLLSEPSRFSASRPPSKHATNREGYKVHDTNHQEGTKRVTHTELLDQLRSSKHSKKQAHMAVTIPRMNDNGEDMNVNTDVCSNSNKMNGQQSNGVSLNYTTIDGGSNCGNTANVNMRLLDYEYPERLVNISGMWGAAKNKMRIGPFATVTSIQDGERILLIFHEYAHLTEDHVGRSIHSALHIRDGGSIVNDTTTHLGGTQNIITPSNHVIPLVFNNGIPYMVNKYPSKKDLDNLVSIVMTQNEPWTPHQHDYSHGEHWYGTLEDGEHNEQT